MNKKFRALSEIKKELKIDWYRTKIDRDLLKQLTRKSNKKGFIQALGHFGLFLMSGSLVFILWSRALWIPMIVMMFIHGTITSFFTGVAPHELSHNTVFKTKWLNRFFLNVFSTISFWNHYDYSISHALHHKYTLHPDGDREVYLPLAPKSGFWDFLQLFTINIYSKPGNTFTQGGCVSTVINTLRTALKIEDKSDSIRSGWIKAIHEENPETAQKAVLWARWVLVFHLLILTYSIISSYWIISIIVSIAPFTANAASYFTGVLQHAGLVSNKKDFRENCRSIKLNPVLEFLYWHMNWHIEHHMYAAVPCYNLKKMAAAISDDLPEPVSLRTGWRQFKIAWEAEH